MQRNRTQFFTHNQSVKNWPPGHAPGAAAPVPVRLLPARTPNVRFAPSGVTNGGRGWAAFRYPEGQFSLLPRQTHKRPSPSRKQLPNQRPG